MTCNDNPNPIATNTTYKACYNSDPIVRGYDPEPIDLASVPQDIIVQQVIRDIVAVSDLDFQPLLWPEAVPEGIPELFQAADTLNYYFTDPLIPRSQKRSYYVSALPNGTTTGILRQHVMRLNSSIHCSAVDSAKFPRNCPGRRPFATLFSRPSILNVSVCVPGAYDVVPWSSSRNRQDITEEIFIDVFVPTASVLREGNLNAANFTIHCAANTTRGYFEPGNSRNDNTASPLIDQWPDTTVMASDFNDVMGSYNSYAIPSVK